jgi:hypothetical protein
MCRPRRGQVVEGEGLVTRYILGKLAVCPAFSKKATSPKSFEYRGAKASEYRGAPAPDLMVQRSF